MDNKITFGGSMTSQINFAMQQNYVPVFRSIILTNATEASLENVKLRISFEPEFAKVYESMPVELRPGQPVEVSPINIVMNAEYLFNTQSVL